jgi:hypothetical protein
MRIIFILAFVISCSNQSLDKLVFGKSTKDDLVRSKGEPAKIYETPISGVVVYEYEAQEKFQITAAGLVQNKMREPTESEKDLNYWRNTLRDCDFTKSQNQQSVGHEILSEYHCKSSGINLVFSANQELIIKVIEYEKTL